MRVRGQLTGGRESCDFLLGGSGVGSNTGILNVVSHLVRSVFKPMCNLVLY